ncbi:MAG TPA: carbohydrate-binding family V/XII, partial [Burkholderiales bacterium]|nr:carbohydrate-binding family V/XII [Burkholderiales bacterium]
YQPQLERWADNNLSGRAAVAVTRPGEKEPRYGVIELTARTQVDKPADLVTLSAVRIVKSSFPGATPEEAERYLATLRAAVTKTEWPVSAQALQANLAIAQTQSKQKALPVKNDPPQILFRTVPSLLALVDGEPTLRDAKDATGLKRVANMSALMLLEESSATYYLWALERWWQSKAVGGEWQAAPAPPASLERARAALGKEFNPLDGKDADGKPVFEPGITPQIIVATRPTELLQSLGEPKLTPIPGTQLLYVANSRNDILMDLGGQAYYALISGRWFTAKALTGPWSFASAKSLPADFARIPAGHPMGDVRMSVAGTPEAREAAIANTIPQTATVQRDIKPTSVNYDAGPPQWKPIEGTPLSYAFNAPAAVIRVDPKTYYMVQNGVWFTGPSPFSWSVATTVPAVIYTIPANSPMHYVTYVRVYGSTPTVVYVGYTPGYYGTVLSSDGVVVYGTGYVYPYYVGPYYYYPPPYYTYGYGAGFTVGLFFGFAMGGGWHGPCCYGGGGGVYISHHNNININNSYNRWGGKSTSISGPGGREVKASQVGNTTFAKGSGSNNVYAGRDGNVYKNEGGDWQKYGGKGEGWSDLDKPQRGERPSQQPAGGAGTRDRPEQSLPGETRSSLDRQQQSRDVGTQRANDVRQSGGGGGGFQGGGGARGGGFGGGGGRGGGGRR